MHLNIYALLMQVMPQLVAKNIHFISFANLLKYIKQ